MGSTGRYQYFGYKGSMVLTSSIDVDLGNGCLMFYCLYAQTDNKGPGGQLVRVVI